MSHEGSPTPTQDAPNDTMDALQTFDPREAEFLLRPENQEFLMGSRRIPILRDKRRGVRIKFVLAALLSLVALYCLIEFQRIYSQNGELRDHGILVSGQIVGKHTATRFNRGVLGYMETKYSVTYSYTYDGKTYEGRGKVDALTYLTGSRGEEIMVRVSSKNPDLARLETEEPPGMQVGGVAVLTGGIAVYLIGPSLLGAVREWRHRRKGQVIAGVAVNSSHRYEGYGKYRKFHAKIVVRFHTPAGKTMTKTIRSDNEKLLPSLPTNKKVAIYYVDDGHWWLL